MKLTEIKKIVDSVYDANGIQQRPVAIRFNKNLVKAAARAYFNPNKNTPRLIQFSVRIWEKLSEEQKRNLVIHEAAHLVKRDAGLWGESHGKEWEQCVVNSGGTPEKISPITAREIHIPVDCCKPGFITELQFARLKMGTKYICGICGQEITINKVRKK